MTPLEIAAEAYRKAELEFQAADAAEDLLCNRLRDEWAAIEAAHPGLGELQRRYNAACELRRTAVYSVTMARDALTSAAKAAKP